MLIRYFLATIFLTLTILSGCKKNDPVNPAATLQLASVQIDGTSINLSGSVSTGLATDKPLFILFSSSLDISSAPSAITLKSQTGAVEVDYSFQNNTKTVVLIPKQNLSSNTEYTVVISNQLKGLNKEIFPGVQVDFKTAIIELTILSYKFSGQVSNSVRTIDVPLNLSIEINFSAPVKTETSVGAITLTGPNSSTPIINFSDDKKTMTITRSTPLLYLSHYTLLLSNSIQGEGGEIFTGGTKEFYSAVGNHTSGLPAKTDNELLDLVQQQTFQYFWDVTGQSGGHSASGMAKERNNSGNTVTTGGSGFGIMAVIVGVKRGFVTRTEGIARLNKIVGFLENAPRFHGAWAHWMNGDTGTVIPFSPDDNGGDLVETSFLMEGLITFRQYLSSLPTVTTDTMGNNLVNRITTLYNGVEWDWYRNGGQNVLYWHWSPDKGWIMNFPLYGYFEEQITYILAAGSPTHGIPAIVYANGYGLNGNIVNGQSYAFGGESHTLPLGSPAPLFWVQYSYTGMDPHFSDDYANYWTQNTNASLISHAYCKANPNFYAGYSDFCWGLTASDNPTGYGAQSVGDDNGTITPTAALSSFPYTPTESMKALRFFYDIIGDRIWDANYGPHDAFNVTADWYADSFLAIDQGPIPVMIENYRSSGFIWNLFMSAPEIQTAKTTLNFH